MAAFVCIQSELVNELMDVLGLDGREIVSLQLNFSAGEIATATIVRHLNTNEAATLTFIAKKHYLEIGPEVVTAEEAKKNRERVAQLNGTPGASAALAEAEGSR